MSNNIANYTKIDGWGITSDKAYNQISQNVTAEQVATICNNNAACIGFALNMNGTIWDWPHDQPPVYAYVFSSGTPYAINTLRWYGKINPTVENPRDAKTRVPSSDVSYIPVPRNVVTLTSVNVSSVTYTRGCYLDGELGVYQAGGNSGYDGLQGAIIPMGFKVSFYRGHLEYNNSGGTNEFVIITNAGLSSSTFSSSDLDGVSGALNSMIIEQIPFSIHDNFLAMDDYGGIDTADATVLRRNWCKQSADNISSQLCIDFYNSQPTLDIFDDRLTLCINANDATSRACVGFINSSITSGKTGTQTQALGFVTTICEATPTLAQCACYNVNKNASACITDTTLKTLPGCTGIQQTFQTVAVSNFLAARFYCASPDCISSPNSQLVLTPVLPNTVVCPAIQACISLFTGATIMNSTTVTDCKNLGVTAANAGGIPDPTSDTPSSPTPTPSPSGQAAIDHSSSAGSDAATSAAQAGGDNATIGAAASDAAYKAAITSGSNTNDSSDAAVAAAIAGVVANNGSQADQDAAAAAALKAHPKSHLALVIGIILGILFFLLLIVFAVTT